jgi:aryl-alcohol dehydrogenase-like predicted oxidoreductase
LQSVAIRSKSPAAKICATSTHFDLANDYGPPYGSAEETFGQILRKDLAGHRDEIVVSTRAGWDMWPGPARANACATELPIAPAPP